MKLNQSLSLGCGLIGIGREWGHKKTAIPTENVVQTFLRSAFDSGIRYFDTAPSYGTSEERLGNFLQTLSKKELSETFIATKFGEHWNAEKDEAYTDHSYEALTQSIDQSLNRLRKIDLLYLHKTTPAVLQSADLAKAIEYARKKGIKKFGASVSDIESANLVLKSKDFEFIQFPYNEANTRFAACIKLAKVNNKTVVINRPFNMGASLYEKNSVDPFEQKVKAYSFILKEKFEGYILTGTKDPKHLEENLEAFKEAQNNY